MKKFLILIAVAILSVTAFAQTQAPQLSDKAKFEITHEQLVVTQLQVQMNQITQRYQDALKADPDFKKVNDAMQEHVSKAQALVAAEAKTMKVDSSLVFDYSTLTWKKPEKPETAKAQ